MLLPYSHKHTREGQQLWWGKSELWAHVFWNHPSVSECDLYNIFIQLHTLCNVSNIEEQLSSDDVIGHMLVSYQQKIKIVLSFLSGISLLALGSYDHDHENKGKEQFLWCLLLSELQFAAQTWLKETLTLMLRKSVTEGQQISIDYWASNSVCHSEQFVYKAGLITRVH